MPTTNSSLQLISTAGAGNPHQHRNGRRRALFAAQAADLAHMGVQGERAAAPCPRVRPSRVAGRGNPAHRRGYAEMRAPERRQASTGAGEQLTLIDPPPFCPTLSQAWKPAATAH